MEELENHWESVLDVDNVARVIAKLTERDHKNDEWPEPGMKSAAVLVPLVTVDKVPSVLFTLRSRELSQHRNQVSFPGGSADATDDTPIATALRETEEEIGISPADVEIWGKLNSLPTSRNLSSNITPVIGHVRQLDMSQLRINQSEVVEVFTVPIHHLANQQNHRFTEFRIKPGLPNYRTPVFLGGPRRIWGFTAFILDIFLTRLVPIGHRYVPIISKTLSRTAGRQVKYNSCF